MKKPIHKRSKKWPTIEEFWASEDPKPFRLLASEAADYRKFRRWLRNHLRMVDASGFDFDAVAMETFRNDKDLDVCLGDYDIKEEVNTEMAIFKWNNKVYMSEEEIKKLTEEQKRIPVPPVMFDLSKAERIVTDKSKLKIQEIQAE